MEFLTQGSAIYFIAQDQLIKPQNSSSERKVGSLLMEYPRMRGGESNSVTNDDVDDDKCPRCRGHRAYEHSDRDGMGCVLIDWWRIGRRNSRWEANNLRLLQRGGGKTNRSAEGRLLLGKIFGNGKCLQAEAHKHTFTMGGSFDCARQKCGTRTRPQQNQGIIWQ